MNEMKVKGIARKSRGHWRETEMQENARAEREEPDRTKRERNANKQFMGNGWMEWAGKRMDKKDAKLREMKGR